MKSVQKLFYTFYKPLLICGLLLCFPASVSISQNPTKYNEQILRRYALTYLFYHYEFNKMLYRPLRVVGNMAIIQRDSSEVSTVPLSKINYVYARVFPIQHPEYSNLFAFDIPRQKPADLDSLPNRRNSLIGGGLYFLFNDSNKVTDYLEGAAFYNKLFEDNAITYVELKQELQRSPYFFQSLDEAYQAVLDAANYIVNCDSGIHIYEDGILFCPTEDLRRKVYFNHIISVNIMDFLKILKHPDSTAQKYIYFSVERQIGETNNAVVNGDSVLLIPLQQFLRTDIEKAYQLEDAMIYLATY